MPNLTNRLQFVAMSTPARIRALSLENWQESNDGLILNAINEVSAEVTEFLGMHTLRAARTEVYRIKRFAKIVSLDAVDIASEVTVKISSAPTHLADTTPLVQDRDFVVNSRAGFIELLTEQPFTPGFVQVTYTGGLFTGDLELGTKHAWATAAVDKQVVYRLSRRDSLGGDIQTIAGQGTTFNSAYAMLDSVRASLLLHRRGSL